MTELNRADLVEALRALGDDEARQVFTEARGTTEDLKQKAADAIRTYQRGDATIHIRPDRSAS